MYQGPNDVELWSGDVQQLFGHVLGSVALVFSVCVASSKAFFPIHHSTVQNGQTLAWSGSNQRSLSALEDK